MRDSRVGAREIQDDPRIFYCVRKIESAQKNYGWGACCKDTGSQYEGTPIVQIWDYLNTKTIKYSNEL